MRTASMRAREIPTPPMIESWKPRSNAAAGALAGLLAGIAYLSAQMLASAVVRDEAAVAPLLRISAILLGPDAALPTAELDFVNVSMALFIQVPLAIAYGRLIAAIIRRFDLLMLQAVAAGMLTGIGLYVVNYWFIVPAAFPWFDVHGGVLTLAYHALFGMLTGYLYCRLRPARR
jgi:hypothetical protein